MKSIFHSTQHFHHYHKQIQRSYITADTQLFYVIHNKTVVTHISQINTFVCVFFPTRRFCSICCKLCESILGSVGRTGSLRFLCGNCSVCVPHGHRQKYLGLLHFLHALQSYLHAAYHHSNVSKAVNLYPFS